MELALHHNSNLETLIKESQKGFGPITASQLWLDGNPTSKVFGEAARDKLLSFGLIEKVEGERMVYRLTEKGWNFESFEIEKSLRLSVDSVPC